MLLLIIKAVSYSSQSMNQPMLLTGILPHPDIWFATTRTNAFGASVDVDLFASLTDPEAEGTGIYFSPLDPKTLYVNMVG